MNYTIKIHPLARLDITKSRDWYNEQKEGLGHKFYDAIALHIDQLSDNPHLFQVQSNEVRQAYVKKFSFAVHYLIEEQEKQVFVIAILHTSRNPEIWKTRLS